MNARRATLLLLLAISVLAASVAACGGGGNPKIKAFSSSSTNVPLPGGDVTFTWNVKGEDTLELKPYGAVNGTGITINVSESTEFTLVAKGNGRSDRETIFVGVGEPFAVHGRVLKPSYAPMSGVAVFSQGKSALTDVAGNFDIDGLVAPYDIVVSDPSNTAFLQVYQGLTRPDPTVVAQLVTAPFSSSISGTVSGVAFPTPTPPPASGTRVHVFNRDGYRSQTEVNAADGTYNVGLGWSSSSETTCKVTTLRWLENVEGVPNSFPGFARTTGHSVESGTPIVVNPALSPVAALSLQGSVTSEVPMGPLNAWSTIDFGMPEVQLQSGVQLYALIDAIDLKSAVVTTATSFTRYVPDVGANYALTVSGNDAMSTGSMSHTRRNLAGGATNVAFHLPAPPRILLPVNSAVLTSSTLFAVSSPLEDETIFLHNFSFSTVITGFYIVVYSADDTIHFPEIEALGIRRDDVTSGSYYVTTYGPIGSMDELAGPNGIVTAGDDSYSGYSFSSRNYFGN